MSERRAEETAVKIASLELSRLNVVPAMAVRHWFSSASIFNRVCRLVGAEVKTHDNGYMFKTKKM